MKRTLLVLALTIASAAALAQLAPPPPGPGRDPGAVLAQYLGLTSDQQTAWRAAHDDFRIATQPLHDQQQAAQKKVHDLLSSGSTDATAIGNAMLAVRAIEDQIKAAHDAMETKLEAGLTAEQKTKYEAFEAAAEVLRGHGPR
jgi:Spy/CpxP family protein refolding chaperone